MNIQLGNVSSWVCLWIWLFFRRNPVTLLWVSRSSLLSPNIYWALTMYRGQVTYHRKWGHGLDGVFALRSVQSSWRDRHWADFFFTTKIAIAIDTRKEKARGSKDKSEEEGHCTLSGSSGKASPRKWCLNWEMEGEQKSVKQRASGGDVGREA